MGPPQNLSSRKRKQTSFSSPLSSNSNPFVGIFTRSKAQLHLHLSRSGRAWPGRNPFQQQLHLMLNTLVQEPREMRQRFEGIEAASNFAVKKKVSGLGRARTRVRVSKVLSSDGVVGGRECVQFEIGKQVGGKGCPSGGLESDLYVDVGSKSLGSGLISGSDLSGSDKVDGESTQDLDPVSMDSDPAVVVGNLDLLDKENQKEEASKNGKNCFIDKRNSSFPGKRLGKVFKAPASFSYRRLLPFLTEMAKNDSSAPCNAQNSKIVDSSLPSLLPNCDAAKCDYTSQVSDCNGVAEDGDIQPTGVQCPVEGTDLQDPSNGSAQTEEYNEMLTTEQRNDTTNKVDKFAEEGVQTTPPDATIFSKLDIDNRRALGERKTPYIEIQLFGVKPSNTTCSEDVCDSGNFQQSPSRKGDSSPKTKPFLNRCSRLKIFKTYSFSYRRLLPYLMDVANSDSCASNMYKPPEFNDDSLRFCKSVSTLSSGNDVSVDKIRRDDLHEEFHAEEQDLNVLSASPPIHASSADIYSGNRSPHDACDNSASGKTTAASEATAGKPDMQLHVELEQAVQHEAAVAKTDMQPPFHLETTKQHENGKSESSERNKRKPSNDDVKDTDGEVNISVETSSSTTECEFLPPEPISEVSQHWPRDGSRLVERASLNSGLLPVEEFGRHGTQNRSPTKGIKEQAGAWMHPVYTRSGEGPSQKRNPTKGILKRNPRGCRGLCNCLNCSSFRLHAERSFEFSRNQLLDAEELAFSLIDELAKLRNLLEKSTGDGCDLAVINCNQVKEACRKALITEQVAKQRLSLLNEDLNVHCRHAPLLRPRVTFSEHIEERAVPGTDFPTSSKPAGAKKI